MPDPLYPKVVCGYVESEPGEDARVLAERIAERDGGELNVVHVEKGSPAEVLRELARRGRRTSSSSARPTAPPSGWWRRAASPSICSRAPAAGW